MCTCSGQTSVRHCSDKKKHSFPNMRMHIVFALIVLLAETIRSSDVDVVRKLAELDAKIAQLDAKVLQLERERNQDKAIIQALQTSIKHDHQQTKTSRTQTVNEEMVQFPAALKKITPYKRNLHLFIDLFTVLTSPSS
jgi:seryl-tRNA synthetase